MGTTLVTYGDFLQGRSRPDAIPLGLSEESGRDTTKEAQWKGFVRKSALEADGLHLADALVVLRGFLMPLADAFAKGTAFDKSWPAGGPWRSPR